jgi:hypothetical protein
MSISGVQKHPATSLREFDEVQRIKPVREGTPQAFQNIGINSEGN